jgi:hypothetical protein
MDSSSFLIRLEAAKKEREVSNSGVPCELNAAYRLLADWWDSLSPKQQKRYLELHPRSRKHKLGKKDEPAAESQKEPAKQEPKAPERTETPKSKPEPKAENTPKAPEAKQPEPPKSESQPSESKPVKGKAAHKAATPVGLDDSHRNAIKEYTGSMYIDVNQALRKGKPIPAADRKDMKLVDEAFSKAKTTEPLEVYRGIGPSDSDMFANLKAGDSFQDKGFVSTSTDKDTADNFSRGDTPTMMQINVPKGSKAISVDSMSVFQKGGHAKRSENEILLNRGGSFKVLSIKPAKRGQPRIITVEYQDA